MKKILVINYSRSGTTTLIANKLAKKLNADIDVVIDKKSRKGPLGYIVGGKDALQKKLTYIEPLQKEVSKYDLVVIGTPNWTGTIPPAIRTFLTQNKNTIKKVAFFQTRGGDDNQNVFLAMEKIIDKKPIAILGLKTKEVRKELKEESVDLFVKQIKLAK